MFPLALVLLHILFDPVFKVTKKCLCILSVVYILIVNAHVATKKAKCYQIQVQKVKFF